MLEILLIRHGETDWNVVGRIQGHTDIPLNALGQRQAAQVALACAATPLATIYSSDLQRAQQTAQAIADAQQLSVTLSPLLRERCYGCFEGLTPDEIELSYPDAYTLWQTRDPAYVIPQGESLQTFYARVITAFSTWVAQAAQGYPEQRVALVAHGGVLDCVYRYMTGMGLGQPRSFTLHNAALNRVQFDAAANRYAILEWGNCSHLQVLQAPARDEMSEPQACPVDKRLL
ncbi:histidine phosphatase family protein [Parvibium lacunae]|uniref:Histidine phosphatase family protein n=1 Tax=Parvibium lacunae TaxID=1888893 RepID=A0A368KZP0_9BURK|nr:histidine phosphatase family protein [Parvibium lacunae]RCS56777.1 histidine phosphatase family protein [Parvibium lacunae]